LHDVSLAVLPGEIVTVIGPNGAGKTTLLRVVLGLQRPDAGRVHRRSGLRVGYVPQRFAIDESLPLTVRRFLALVPAAEPQIAAALGEVGAAHTLALPVQTLSGGELQRVLLARALLRRPELLVLDEPAQGVDITGQAELFALIRRIRDSTGCGVLLVSHDLHLVMAATDRVICLNHHVCCSGHPEAVSRDPAYRALFGAAIDGFALYAHRHDHHHDAAETASEHG
jgi:zinc transport system ATP-binding protein